MVWQHISRSHSTSNQIKANFLDIMGWSPCLCTYLFISVFIHLF